MLSAAEMGTHSDGLLLLTARHGCKCMPDESITVEDVLNAIGVDLGASNILSASRINKAIVVFLKEESMVVDLVERGLIVGNAFVSEKKKCVYVLQYGAQ